jgi:hypothetical protein
MISAPARPGREILPEQYMNQEVIRKILWNVPIAFRIFFYAMLIPLTAAFIHEGMCYVGFRGRFIGATIIFFNDGIAMAAGFFGSPYYLVGMMEVL